MVRYRNAAASSECLLAHLAKLRECSVLTTNWWTSEPLTVYMHVPAIVSRSTRLNDHFDGHIVWSASFPQHCIGANHGVQWQTDSALSSRENLKTSVFEAKPLPMVWHKRSYDVQLRNLAKTLKHQVLQRPG
jgi:hypothetical protein